MRSDDTTVGCTWRRRGILLVVGGAWSVACGSPASQVAPLHIDACALTSGPSIRDTIVVGLGGSVDLVHAPVPRSPAERLLFRHLYQTLIEVDCLGEVTSGLAESWTAHDDARIWTFTLRSDAFFWDGTPVTAASVKASWLAGASDRVAPWADSIAGSVSAVGQRELTVRLRRPYEEVPRVFADPTLAVAHAVDTLGAVPTGSGTYHVTDYGLDEIRLAPLGALRSDELPVLRFLDTGDDPRDAIDQGVDVLVAGEPIVVDYIAGMDGLSAVPLPWDLVYVLATPLRLATDDESGARGALAEVLGSATVRVESRLPEPSSWWDDFSACRLSTSFSARPDPGGIAGRILYRRVDPAARALAERLVALAASGGLPQVTGDSEHLTATGLGDERFAASLADGRDLGYVFSMPKQVFDRCAMIRPLREALPWVTASDLRRVLVPLVETRSQLIVSRAVGEVVVGWDGVPYLSVATGR